MTEEDVKDLEKLRAARERRRVYMRNYYRRLREADRTLRAQAASLMQFRQSEKPSNAE